MFVFLQTEKELIVYYENIRRLQNRVLSYKRVLHNLDYGMQDYINARQNVYGNLKHEFAVKRLMDAQQKRIDDVKASMAPFEQELENLMKN